MTEPLPTFPPRLPTSHKGSFGRVLLVAGSQGMSGAAILAGLAALRGGAGLVTIACPDVIANIVAGYEPSYMTLSFRSDDRGRLTSACLPKLLERRYDAVAVGPGLGQSDVLRSLVARLVENVEAPLVIDADGLNLLVGQTEILKRRPAPTVLTPHAAEFSRLSGLPVDEVTNDEEIPKRFAKEWGVVLALKRPGILVTDGTQSWRNPTGNPGMATGGTGDVLTGLLTAILGQGLSVYDGARLAAYVHGRAGDLAAQARGEVSLIARDLIDTLPEAIAEHVKK